MDPQWNGIWGTNPSFIWHFEGIIISKNYYRDLFETNFIKDVHETHIEYQFESKHCCINLHLVSSMGIDFFAHLNTINWLNRSVTIHQRLPNTVSVYMYIPFFLHIKNLIFACFDFNYSSFLWIYLINLA